MNLVQKAKRAAAAVGDKARDTELAVGQAVNRGPGIAFWLLLVAALAGGKFISQLMR